jgi:NADH:ubiquinone oxidoreductase subunit F (NADH-binding)
VPQQQIVLKHCAVVDPNRISTYEERGGFQALKKVVSKMTPGDVINCVRHSQLKGRGGAGFPTGLKWELTAKQKENERFVICNADEGEAGTFKDRYIIERDPFSLIEGILIACYAVSARNAFIYLRAEYSRFMPLLENALEAVRQRGYSGNDTFPKVNIEIVLGAGAYVCGEETALIESMEDKRGEVRYKPPFPVSAGLDDKPTVVNNVETLMNVPRIIENGADWFASIGTERSKGTKVFSVCGDVERPGVYELVMGSPLRELVETIAGAQSAGMVQVGGLSGRVVPYSEIDVPLTFETVLGAGAIIVHNKTRDPVEVALKSTEFFLEESCGKCAPCREGTQAIYQTLLALTKGKCSRIALNALKEVAVAMSLSSMCGLGQTAPNAFMDTLRHFPQAYESRVAKG